MDAHRLLLRVDHGVRYTVSLSGVQAEHRAVRPDTSLVAMARSSFVGFGPGMGRAGGLGARGWNSNAQRQM